MKKFFTLFLTLMTSVMLWAYDFQSGDLYYNITSDVEPYTVEVTSKYFDAPFNKGVTYTSVTIPSSVTYNGITYAVTGIGSRAFMECYSLTSVTIPNSVTSIGEFAFEYCSSLTSVTIPNSVTSIGDDAFDYCSSLPVENNLRYADTYLVEAVDKTLSTYSIKEGTKWIGNDAFYYCSSLTSITIPNSVTSIGWSAFNRCSALTSVTIGNNVAIIDWYAFCNCSSLTSITIPNSVTSIKNQAFQRCSSLTSVTIGNNVTLIDNIAFFECSSLDTLRILATTPPTLRDEVFSRTPSPICYIPCGTKSAYEVSDWAQYVSEFVEEPCEEYTITYTSTDGNIVIPNKVDAFGANIVSNTYQDGQGVITFDGPVKSIGDSAFYLCPGMASITIPNNVTSIGKAAFTYCPSLISITIPNSVTSIGYEAFYGCSSLTSITIPESVTSIGSSAFSGCPSLTSMVVEAGNTKYDSRENCNAIVEKATNTLIAGCQNTVIPNSVTSIGGYAFWDCTSLTSITIPNSVTSIGSSAFNGCSSLTSVTIPNSVTSIGWYAFNLCTSLESVTIPHSVTSIGENVFYGCSSLTSVTLGSGVTSIGYGTFSNCSSLTSVTLGSGVESIGDWAFDDCTSLTSITCKATTPPALGTDAFPSELTTAYIPCGTNAAYEASDWASYSITSFIEEECPEPVDPTWQITYTSTNGKVTPNRTNVFGANIVNNEYKDGQGVITFDGPVTSIGDRAFEGRSSLTSITIPNSVTSIRDAAFNDCSSLTSIEIPNSVTSIHTFAFARCSSLVEIEIPKSVISIGDSDDGRLWACQGIFMGCNNLQKIIVEEGNPIFDSRDNCNAIIETATNTLIAGCPNTEIPNGIKRIGTGAFRDCNALGDIDIPSSVNVIGYAAFYGTGITNVVIPSNCIVEDADATYSSSYTVLFGAFARCEQLTEVVIPEGTTRIASGMLAGCSSLESLTIPTSVTSIGEWAFYKCDALTSITIPDGVTSIEEGTFMRCSKLTSITIPSGVTNIGYYAFGECILLSSVTCEATTPPMLEDLKGSPVFTSSPICYIPCGTKAAYEASDWAQYVSEFVEDCDNGSYSRNVRIGYNTICLPHGSSHFTGATFYEIAHILKNKKKIFFDEVKTLEAGKPYIFYPHSNEVTVYYDNTTSAVPLSHNGLHGTFDGITAASNFLKGKYLVVGDRMVLCGDGCSLAANRAYIELDEISDKDHPAIPGIKRVSMDYSEENATTALDNITDESIVAPMQEGVYDILGRKVDAPTVSGFYIINGKKVFIAL